MTDNTTMKQESKESRKKCHHGKIPRQCTECYGENKANGIPTPGWHQLCDRLYKNCKCELNEQLKQLVKRFLLQLKQKYIENKKSANVEFCEFMLAQINNESGFCKLPKRSEALADTFFSLMMKMDEFTVFDYKDRLDLCKHLQIISPTKHAQLWIEEEYIPENELCAPANVGKKRRLDENNVNNASGV